MSQSSWNLAYCMEVEIESFKGFCKLIADNLDDWQEYTLSDSDNYFDDIPCELNAKLTNFDKLLVMKVFKAEKLLFAF